MSEAKNQGDEEKLEQILESESEDERDSEELSACGD